MRYKPEHKIETRRRIVETASKEFRAHGFDGTGIATLMEAAKLTHGGFYAHFADKENLVAEASVLALDQSLERIRAAIESGGLSAVLELYLGEAHRDTPTEGCPLPALSAEIARRPAATRQEFTDKLTVLFGTLAQSMSGETADDKRADAYLFLASMVGAVALARAVSDPQLSDAILVSAKEQLLKFYS